MNKFDDVIRLMEDENRKPNDGVVEGYFFLDDFSDSNLEIIINSNILFKLESFLEDTKKYKKEFGCFLYGNSLDDNTIYFDKISYEDFVSYYDYIEVSENNLCELREFVGKDMFDTVIHVHTHPELGDEYISCCYAAQDLYAYGYFQLYHQYSEYYTIYIGCMINSHDGEDNISFVYYDEEDRTFYKIPNVYCDSYSTENKKLIKSRYCLK